MSRPKRCWNCRARKKSCDRQVPSCGSCKKRGEICVGYGILLSWPKDPGSRRAFFCVPKVQLPIHGRPLYFIDLGNRDIELAVRLRDPNWSQTCQNHFAHEVALPRVPETVPSHYLGQSAYLASEGYDEVAIVQMAFGNNAVDIQQLLVKMIANSTKSSAMALRQALLALSFQFFVVPSKAIQHQNQAIQYLQTSIDRSLPWDKDEALQAIAASMLLSVYEMENGESSLRWAIFFSGTKRIVDTIYTPGETYEGDSGIMIDWIFYYYTMCKFSVLHWLRKDEQQTWIARQRKIISKPPHSASQHTASSGIIPPRLSGFSLQMGKWKRKIPQANFFMQILPSWGCSLELLDILHEIFDNVFDRDSEQHQSPEHDARLKVLEQRLHHLSQREQHDESKTAQSSTRNTQIAEFYRLAALLYLQRVARNSPRDTPHVIKLVADAYRTLKVMARCDRPWPLFVIALEASTEDERRLVLVTIETLLEHKPLRKWMMLRTMIQQAWSQKDLAKANNLDALLLYQSAINAQRVPPMFI